jgi:hypothetical protein
MKLRSIFISLILGSILLLIAVQVNGQSEPNSGLESPEIKLSLLAPKSVSKTRNGVMKLTVLMENKSKSKTYYIGDSAQGLVSSLYNHYFLISVFTLDGKQVSLGYGSADPLPGYKQDLQEFIKNKYIPLRPGRIHGLTQNLLISIFKPGKYKLRVSYYEKAATIWNEKELSGLLFPIWTDNLTSNTVQVIITK